MDRVPGRRALLVVLCGLVAAHLIAVTFAAVPPNRTSRALEPASNYLTPYFAQNWRLFAPNPVAADRSIEFQFAYRDEAGDVAQTEWVDWTEVELDLVTHRLVGGRAGYVTTKMIESLSASYRRLTSAQHNAAAAGRDDPPQSWADLTKELKTAGVAPASLASYLKYERAVARLGTDIAAARFPDRSITGVRYAVVLQDVTPYRDRSGSEAEREAARPAPTRRLSGWREPIEGSARERRAVADFDDRHAP